MTFPSDSYRANVQPGSPDDLLASLKVVIKANPTPYGGEEVESLMNDALQNFLGGEAGFESSWDLPTVAGYSETQRRCHLWKSAAFPSGEEGSTTFKVYISILAIKLKEGPRFLFRPSKSGKQELHVLVDIDAYGALLDPQSSNDWLQAELVCAIAEWEAGYIIPMDDFEW
ncbi:hypothetical protein VNI00_004217 [Paramarasmius palmivorus]|uniref:Uncharacterized protein n=1 Tax=Paramarasmius palmivorus TaxID=297713 RepID=A0AAW0DNE3_9AGAR